MISRVVRPPHILGTPKRLARALGFRSRKYPNPAIVRTFNYRRDFFMTNISANLVHDAPEGFAQVNAFFDRNKYGQRRILESVGVPVPVVAHTKSEASGRFTNPGLRFVVRPLRHSGGLHYRVTDNPLDFIEGSEYISELYPKKREYRVIFVFGKPLIYLRKKQNEGVTHEEPWGHINSFFQTINDIPTCRLSATDCVSKLSDLLFVKNAHIVAADILFNKSHSSPYAVLELNLCPSLSIEENFNKVVESIRARS